MAAKWLQINKLPKNYTENDDFLSTKRNFQFLERKFSMMPTRGLPLGRHADIFSPIIILKSLVLESAFQINQLKMKLFFALMAVAASSPTPQPKSGQSGDAVSGNFRQSRWVKNGIVS